MVTQRPVLFTVWTAVTIFLSAFLLFQIQPLISKMILPWFGGGPAVWTVCMLFFQVVLLAGYAYAHFLAGMSTARLALAAHLGLLVLAVFLLPIHPDVAWKPADGTRPTYRILQLLALHVGLPYFVLASTGPLIQSWYHRLFFERSPYRLYALSNVGSLGALLSYPFVFEPMMGTVSQGYLWSWSFGVFAAFCGGLAVATHRATGRITTRDEASLPEGVDPEDSDAWSLPPLEHRLAWVFLPALASILLLAVTNHVSQDVAVVPFFWVLPLSLYLLSFILCFDRPLWYRRRLTALATAGAVFLLSMSFMDTTIEKWLKSVRVSFDFSRYTGELVYEATLYMLILFAICMLCHGELVRLKPVPRRLTSFYLMISAGGALGGIVVALICPQVLPSFLELNVGLALAFMLALGVLWDEMWGGWLLRGLVRKTMVFLAGFGLLFLVVRAQFEEVRPEGVDSARNFYGVLYVRDHYRHDPQWYIRELMNGRILHGSQFMAPEKRLVPTTYYNPESGVGMAMQRFRSEIPRRVAVVGLGTGTIGAYGVDGDHYTFYEINPDVIRLANRYFTYLTDTPAEVSVVPGDARLSMERQRPQAFDIIVLDAFTGDAIPAHLLTREAFQEYLRHLTPGGLIAVHISNRHLDLTPVIGGLAQQFGLSSRRIHYRERQKISQASSDWILLTEDTSFWDDPVVSSRIEEVEGTYTAIPLWTDQFSNLFQILD